MLCGPSRLVWFGIGSLVTYAWIRHHRDHCPRVDYHRRGDGRAQWERERERDEAPPPPPSAPNYGEWRQTQSQSQWRPPYQGQGPAAAGAPPATPTLRFDSNSNSTHVVPPPGGPAAGGQFDRETQLLESIGITTADHERLRQMGRSAEETVRTR